MNRLKVGMISFAHGHAVSYLHALTGIPEVEVAGIADPDRERVDEHIRKYGLSYYADYRDLLATDIDAVVICSENVHHAELTIAAARSGKHVLCEKPLGIREEEMEAMVDACRANGVQLMTAFPCRYLAAVAEAKAAVDRGDIGDIVAIKGTNRGSFPGGWFVDPQLSGGGALLDHTVHVMDLMRWFTGSEVKEVYAYAATLFQDRLDVEDAGMIHVKFASGAFGVLDTSWSRQSPYPIWGDVTMEVIGTRGVLSIDGLGQSNEVYSREAGRGAWEYWGDNMDERLIRSFVDALRNGESVAITGEDGRRAAAVALAGYRSWRSGQPVTIA